MSGPDLDNSGPCGATTATAASSGLFSTPRDMGVWLRKLVSVVPPAPSTCMIELEDARRTRLAAENTLVNLERERSAAWVALYRAAGGGWKCWPGPACW